MFLHVTRAGSIMALWTAFIGASTGHALSAVPSGTEQVDPDRTTTQQADPSHESPLRSPCSATSSLEGMLDFLDGIIRKAYANHPQELRQVRAGESGLSDNELLSYRMTIVSKLKVGVS